MKGAARSLDTPLTPDNTLPVRFVFAIATAVLVLLAAGAPHAHDGRLGTHACAACLAAGAEAASCETPDVAPRRLVVAALPQVAPEPPVTGAPLGAVPGQSPPAA